MVQMDGISVVFYWVWMHELDAWDVILTLWKNVSIQDYDHKVSLWTQVCAQIYLTSSGKTKFYWFVFGLHFASAFVRMVLNQSSAIILVFQLIQLTTGLSALQWSYPSFHRATRSCGKHAVSVTTASCVKELHPETDGSQQAPLSQSFCPSFSLILAF